MELKTEMITAMSNLREEYFDVLLNDVRLKDKYGHLWDITKIEFDKHYTILRLGLEGTENYTAVLISTDGDINELEEYEIMLKEESEV